MYRLTYLTYLGEWEVTCGTIHKSAMLISSPTEYRPQVLLNCFSRPAWGQIKTSQHLSNATMRLDTDHSKETFKFWSSKHMNRMHFALNGLTKMRLCFEHIQQWHDLHVISRIYHVSHPNRPNCYKQASSVQNIVKPQSIELQILSTP